MKKLILLLSIVLLVSCSKSDDDSPKTLPLTYQNLVGQWNFKTVIRANGTEVPFVGQCPTQTDYIEAFSYGQISRYNYYQDCTTTAYTYNYYIFPNNFVTASGDPFSDVTITNLTANSFRIEYNTPQSLSYMIDINDAKAIVFERR